MEEYKKIKILHLEDDVEDHELIESFLRQSNIAAEFFRVDDRENFIEALKNQSWDLILSDCTMPAFDGFSALSLAKELAPATPFIFVSGTIGEDKAVEMLKNGATDYVLKGKLPKLVPAIERAVHEVQEREEMKKLQDQVRQSQKMDAMGRLASGIAHDFNNILTVISGYVDLVVNTLPVEASARVDMEEIRKAVKRASELTNQLLVFSRRQTLELTHLDLNHVVISAEKMLQRLIAENIELKTKLSEIPVMAKGNHGQMEQVLTNLVLNARDAMPKGGKITIEVKHVEKKKNGGHHPGDLEPGTYAVITISDTGLGMDEETKARIFEPFFTTKEKGKGTGLGLATSYGIIKQAGGDIQVDTKLGEGTVFTIFLPAVVNKP